MFESNTTYLCEWHIQAIKTSTGELFHEEEDKNIVTLGGRSNAIALLFGLGGSSYIALGAGACSTSALYNDSRLNYEHILNVNRKIPTNQAGSPLSKADIVAETFTDGTGTTYYQKIIIRAQFVGASDANVNQPFQEYSLWSGTVGGVSPCPPTPFGFGSQGSAQPYSMFNHFVAASAIPLTTDVTLIVDTTIRV